MTTFSQLVDAMVAESRRPDMLSEIIAYTNQTLRELHFDPSQGAVTFYRDNFTEQMLIANVDTGFVWDIPDVGIFQAMQVVKYLRHCGTGHEREFPPELVPSRGITHKREFYYRAGSTYMFSGYGGLNAEIAIGFFQYPRRLVYYPVGSRPAEYAPDLGWTYAPPFQGTLELRLSAQAFASNWLLLRWVDVIAEGVRAKLYKRVSDTDRARTCYSLYSTLRAGLVTAETVMLGGFS